jgi:hypothetical protein
MDGVISGFGAVVIEVMTERPRRSLPGSRSPRPGAPRSGQHPALSGRGDELVQVTRKNLPELALD